MNKKKQGYKNIIFDMVGVLFKFNTRKQLQELGLFQTARYLLTHFKNPIKAFLHTMDKLARKEGITNKHIKYKQYYLPICAVEYFSGFKNTYQTVHTIKKKIEQLDLSHFASNLEKKIVADITQMLFSSDKIMYGLVPNKKLISSLKKIAKTQHLRLFLLTNIDKQTFGLLKKSYKNLFSLFDGIVTSCDVHLLKPNQAIYQHLFTTYKVDPAQSVFIDDQSENIEQANRLGITGIQYQNYKTLEKKLKSCGIL